MNRRGFLRFLGVAPLGMVGVVAAQATEPVAVTVKHGEMFEPYIVRTSGKVTSRAARIEASCEGYEREVNLAKVNLNRKMREIELRFR